MRINEVEALVGISKKNIRFYEDAGLISPQRNSQNGYREYSEPDVEMLRRIKLLRKLGFPLEEIRRMQQGSHTVGDGMRRHLISLQREQANLASAARLCERLTACPEKLDALDAQALLAEMETMEQKGTTFMDTRHPSSQAGSSLCPWPWPSGSSGGRSTRIPQTPRPRRWWSLS